MSKDIDELGKVDEASNAVSNIEIELQNIGIIRDSSIKLNGLTVITGANNSGKSTIGKALYSIVEAAKDINENHNKNTELLFASRFVDIDGEMQKLIQSKLPDTITDQLVRRGDDLHKIFDHVKTNKTYLARELFSSFIQFFENIRSSDSVKNMPVGGGIPTSFSPLGGGGSAKISIINSLNRIIEIFRDLEPYVSSTSIINFYESRVGQILTKEFKAQIQYEPCKNASANIRLSLNKEELIHVKIQSNRVWYTGASYLDSPFSRIFLLDNPYSIDNIKRKHNAPTNINQLTYKSYAQSEYTKSLVINQHEEQFVNQMLFSAVQSTLEEQITKEKFADLFHLLNQVVPGDITFKEGGDRDLYYFHEGEYLNVANLATGAKSFATIKLLLTHGHINSDTMLILDEPESHLHPQWQNIFAELIVLLVKNHNIRILLTSHSANFVLAIEAFMYKYGIIGMSNFYRTQQCEDDTRQIQYCKVDDLGVIYEDFIDYFAQVKILRDQYSETYPIS